MDDTAEFRAMLRMTSETYQVLIEKVRPYIEKRDTFYRKCISVEERVSITLKYLATGESGVSLSQQFRVGRSTVSCILRTTLAAIVKGMSQDYLSTPNTEEEWLKIAEIFCQRWQFPNCLGALDGKHVRLCAPPKSGSYYYNYKGFFSLIMLAIVDANYEFLYIDVGAEGRAGDARVWNDSDFNHALHQGLLNIPQDNRLPGSEKIVPYILVGDEAFRLTTHLMKPFARRNLSDRDLIFNYRLSRARRVVENAFGILSNRFRVLHTPIKLLPDTASDVVLSACILHNFLRREVGENYIRLSEEDEQRIDNLSEGAISNLRIDQRRNSTNKAKDIRDTLADYFVSDAGSVEWQTKVLNK